MKNVITISILILFGFFNIQNQTFAGKSSYTLKGKLINEFDNTTPYCGIIAFATVVEFEIIDFSDKEYLPKKIPVIFTCPASIDKSQYRLGEIYEFILTDENPALFEWSFLESKEDILNRYDLNKKYWFVKKN